MTETSVDNTVSYTQKSGWKMLTFLCVFLISGIISIVKFDSYFTDFWKIRNCNPEGYARGDFMTSCAGIKVDRYAFGSIYLGSQKNAVKNAEDADVIIFGNSRTMRSFSTDAIDNYFKSKGLTYMVLASEGASFRSAVLTADKMKLSPKIIMVNNEIFISDEVSDGFRELVDFPDKYKTRYDFFNMAQTIQEKACSSQLLWLKKFYCSGKSKGNWRSARTGRLKWDLVAPEEKQEVVIPRKDIGGRVVPKFVPNAEELIGHPDFKDSCPVLYLVNSPVSSKDMLNGIGDAFSIQTIYTPVEGLYTYDKSHLDRPNSEKWATAFVQDLDIVIDNCLKSNGRPDFDKAAAYMNDYKIQQEELASRRQKAKKAQEKKLQDRKNLEAAADETLRIKLEQRQAKLEATKAAKEKARMPKGVPFDKNSSDTNGITNFENWAVIGSAETFNASQLAPNGQIEADQFFVKKSPARIRLLHRDTQIKAGTRMTFGGWFWSEDEGASVRLQIVRSCSPSTPLETSSLNSPISNEPHRLEISHVFEFDHECALVQILGIGEGSRINMWQGRTDFIPSPTQ